MEGDTGCPREQPRGCAGWEMVGEERWGYLSHLVPSPLACWLWDAAAPRRVAAGPEVLGTKGASRELASGCISCFWILPGAWDVLPARDESLNDSCLLAGDTKTNEV